MKKITIIILPIIIVTSIVTNVITANIGTTSVRDYLESLPDFDWNSDFGDRTEDRTVEGISLDKDQRVKTKDSKANNWDNIFDYSKINTGYQWTESIKKQGVTGSPTSKLFMPNGNIAADFGISSKSSKFQTLNSFLDYDPKKDADAKFNQAVKSLDVVAENVAVPWANTQNPYAKGSYLGDTNIGRRVAISSNIGLRNPFEISLSNYSYLENTVSWGGSFFEGLIKIPTPDFTEAAHTNGVKSYGNIFLDGYHGLSKKMLNDFLKKDENGHFYISKILINLASYYNFDGYFWNNESNGGLPNGTILDYRNIKQMFNEMNEIIKNSNDEHIKKLENTFYSSYSNLGINSNNKPVNQETNDMSKVADKVNLDFGLKPEDVKRFLALNPNWLKNNKQYDIASIIELASTAIRGIFDSRMLSSQYADSNHRSFVDDSEMISAKNRNNEITFVGDAITSLSFFEGNGGASFGNDAYLSLQKSDEYKVAKEKGLLTEWKEQLYKQQASNVADEVLFTGRNRFLRGSAREADPKLENKYNGKIVTGENGGYLINDIQSEDYGITNNGWNGEWSGINRAVIMDTLDVMPQTSFVKSFKENNSLTNNQKKWLFSKDSEGNFVYSFGAGNIINEKTVLNDSNKNEEIISNFSNGNGIKFIDKNNSNNNQQIYPWSNRRLVDLQPTYKWDIKKFESDKKQSNMTNYAQSEVTGFSDYYHVYNKGNSIALGNSLNIDGSLNGFDLENGEEILWNLFGTNYSLDNLDKNVSFKVQANKAEKNNNLLDNSKKVENFDELFDVKIAVTDDSKVKKIDKSFQTTYEDIGNVKLIDTKIEKGDDGWDTISADLNDVKQKFSADKKLSKISLVIKAKKDIDETLFNVGEFSLVNNNLEKEKSDVKVDNINSEYVVDREEFKNVRLSWNASGSLENIDHYVIYLIDGDKKIRFGETTQLSYFIRNIDKDMKLRFGIEPVFKNKDGVSKIYEAKIFK